MQPEMIYIYEVYRTGSFSKAAANLYLSQPALSIAVKKVEKEIGMPLFDRSHQPLQLTEAGRIYIKKILKIKLLEGDMANELQDIANLATGELHIGGTQYFNSYVMPAIIKKYIHYYPHINISLLEDNSGLLDDKLADGSVDIMFHCGKFDEKSFAGAKIFEDHLLLAVHKELLKDKEIAIQGLTAGQVQKNEFEEKDCPIVPLKIFAAMPFLILTKSNNLRERALNICRSAGFTPKVRFYVEQLETSYHLACHGLGAAFVSDRMVKEHSPQDMLYYKLTNEEADRCFQAITRKNGYMSHAMRRFIELARTIWL